MLDRTGVIALFPGDRIRLCIAQNFDWLPNGPIRQFFRREGLSDFLAGRFDQPSETLAFTHGMLTRAPDRRQPYPMACGRTEPANLHWGVELAAPRSACRFERRRQHFLLVVAFHQRQSLELRQQPQASASAIS